MVDAVTDFFQAALSRLIAESILPDFCALAALMKWRFICTQEYTPSML